MTDQLSSTIKAALHRSTRLAMSCTKCGKVGHWASQCTVPPGEWITQGSTPPAPSTQVGSHLRPIDPSEQHVAVVDVSERCAGLCRRRRGSCRSGAPLSSSQQGASNAGRVDTGRSAFESRWAKYGSLHLRSITYHARTRLGLFNCVRVSTRTASWLQVTGLHCAKGGLGAAGRQRQRRQDR